MIPTISSMTHRIRSKHFAVSARHSALFAVIGFFSSVAGAATEWTEASIAMVGVKNYSMERCLEFKAGQKIEFSFTSQSPVNFDVHHHPGNATLFKIKKENISQLNGDFVSDADDHYCLTWVNPADVGSDWSIQLKYRVVN